MTSVAIAATNMLCHGISTIRYLEIYRMIL